MLRTWHDKGEARLNDEKLDCVVNSDNDVAWLVALLLQFLIMLFSRFKQHKNMLIFIEGTEAMV